MRTTHRSTAGKKLYAVRAKDGKFKDVQTHKRASRQDQRVTTVEEATRRLVSACREWKRKYSRTLFADRTPGMDARLVNAIDSLNFATRAAAKRKRARSVKP